MTQAQFYNLLGRLTKFLDVSINNKKDIKKYKWLILNEVHAFTGESFDNSAKIITKITGVKYDRKHLEEFVQNINESLEP